MKMMIIGVIMTCICSANVLAQTLKTNLQILDFETNMPLSYATVVLLDSTRFVSGYYADEQGNLIIQDQTYFTQFEVSYVGYNSEIVKRSMLEDQKTLTLKLMRTSENLESVTIHERRTTTKMDIDRKTYRVGEDLQLTGTTALEAFQQLSEINVDESAGIVSMRGNSNVQILIDGKPSILDNGALLNQIPSSLIEKIEIISSPSARHQANGLSGIINIILKKENKDGINLNFNASAGTKRYGLGYHGNVQSNNVNLRFMSNFHKRDMLSTRRVKRVFDDDSHQILTPHELTDEILNGMVGLDIKLNSKNSLSLDLEINKNLANFYNNSYFSHFNNRDDFVYLRKSTHREQSINFKVRHEVKFKNKQKHINLDYQFSDHSNSFPNQDFIDGEFFQNKDFSFDNKLHIGKIDFVLPLKEGLSIESGLYTQYAILTTTQNIESSTFISSFFMFDYLENTNAIYSQVKAQFDRFVIQGGLRFENFSSFSKTNEHSIFHQLTFNNFFPSVHFSYSFESDAKLALGFSRRISRPSSRNLNPYQLGDPTFRFEGNPLLAPEFSNNMDLNFIKDFENVKLSSTVFYRLRKNTIQRIDRINQDHIQVANYFNIGNSHSYGIEGLISSKMNKYFETSLSGNYYHSSVKASSLYNWNEVYSSTLVSKNVITIHKALVADISYSHTFRRQQIHRYILPRNRIDFAIRSHFLEKKLSLNLRIIDVLNKNLMFRYTQIETYTQEEEWRFQSQTRGFLFSINYNLK